MRIRIWLFVTLILAGCGLFASPTANVKKFIAAAHERDFDAMPRMFSRSALQRLGIDKIRENNERVAELIEKASAAHHTEHISETRAGDQARVYYFYKDDQGIDSTELVFDLVKEERDWKIDDIGGADKEQTTDALTSNPSPSPFIELPSPPAGNANDRSRTTKADDRAPVSAGVLNGKAVSLPQPAYPPAARTVKAAGTVTVQVTVDESGNVMSANPVSGHPLLRPAATAAARNAKFPPTKINGEPFKITGIIIYKFESE